MRVLLDTNVLLDAMLQRPPWHQEADAILRAAAQGQVTCAATTLSLATIFYVGRKVVGNAVARAAVRKCIAAFAILPVDKQTLLDADALPGNDFEDNILIAAASGSVDAIVTRNVADFSHSPIPVLEPGELLRRLSPAGPPPLESGGSMSGVPCWRRAQVGNFVLKVSELGRENGSRYLVLSRLVAPSVHHWPHLVLSGTSRVKPAKIVSAYQPNLSKTYAEMNLE